MMQITKIGNQSLVAFVASSIADQEQLKMNNKDKRSINERLKDLASHRPPTRAPPLPPVEEKTTEMEETKEEDEDFTDREEQTTQAQQFKYNDTVSFMIGIHKMRGKVLHVQNENAKSGNPKILIRTEDGNIIQRKMGSLELVESCEIEEKMSEGGDWEMEMSSSPREWRRMGSYGDQYDMYSPARSDMYLYSAPGEYSYEFSMPQDKKPNAYYTQGDQINYSEIKQDLLGLKLQHLGLPKVVRRGWLSTIETGQMVQQKDDFGFDYANGEYKPQAAGYVKRGARGVITRVLDNGLVEIDFAYRPTELEKRIWEEEAQKQRQFTGIPSTGRARKTNASLGFIQAANYGGVYLVSMEELELFFDFLISGVDY